MKKSTVKDILIVAGCVALIGVMAVLMFWLLSYLCGV